MGRPREFEIDDAVRDAIEVFWTRGYGGASIDDLSDGTGLARGSIYKAFGDKHALFLAALDRYADEALDRMASALRQPGSPKAAITKLLRTSAERIARGGGRGCMITNTTTEMATRDPEIAAHLARLFARMEDLFAETLARAKAAGEIDPSRDERALARFLLVTAQGLRVLGRLRPKPERLIEAVEVALSVLT